MAESIMTPWEVFAVRYAHNPAARRSTNFIAGDPHDAPMPLDYFVWAMKSGDRSIILDTGFDEAISSSINDRKVYRPEDLRFGHVFDNILRDLPDGFIELDITRIHDTTPVAKVGQESAVNVS